MALMKMPTYAGGGGSKPYTHTYATFPTNGVFDGIGFEPKYVAVMTAKRSGNTESLIYDNGVSPTQYKLLSGGTEYTLNVGSTGDVGFMSIDADGFTLNNNFAGNWTANIYVVAI